jgi:hypothetical protein
MTHQGAGEPSANAYANGCRCQFCRIAWREQRRSQRAAARGELVSALASVPPVPDDAPAEATGPGPCERALRAELAALPAASEMGAECEALIALMRQVDSGRIRGASLETATARLFDGLQRIRSAKAPTSARLREVALLKTETARRPWRRRGRRAVRVRRAGRGSGALTNRDRLGRRHTPHRLPGERSESIRHHSCRCRRAWTSVWCVANLVEPEQVRRLYRHPGNCRLSEVEPARDGRLAVSVDQRRPSKRIRQGTAGSSTNGSGRRRSVKPE